MQILQDGQRLSKWNVLYIVSRYLQVFIRTSLILTSHTSIHDGDILDSMASQRVPQGSTPRNYFPVRWRVIGGGVLVGSASTNPEDVTEQALDDEQDDEQLHLAACSAFPSSTPRPIEQAKIKQAKPNFTSTRKRSNSFPTQPTASFISKKHVRKPLITLP